MKKRNRNLLALTKRTHAQKKLAFRQNFINKMNFLNPKMVLMVNSQSDIFFGYDREREHFIRGMFYDSLLGDLFELEQKEQSVYFEDHLKYFMENMDHDSQELVARYFYYDRGGVQREDGYCYSSSFAPTEIRLKKNGNIIARSRPLSPKHKGYFNESLYRDVVEDTGGKGVSKLSVSIAFWNGGQEEVMETFYVFEDQPRVSVGQNVDHYTKVCSLFTPLICEVEEDILCKNINYGEYLYDGMVGTEEQTDDTLLGLPANHRYVYKKRT